MGTRECPEGLREALEEMNQEIEKLGVSSKLEWVDVCGGDSLIVREKEGLVFFPLPPVSHKGLDKIHDIMDRILQKRGVKLKRPDFLEERVAEAKEREAVPLCPKCYNTGFYTVDGTGVIGGWRRVKCDCGRSLLGGDT